MKQNKSQQANNNLPALDLHKLMELAVIAAFRAGEEILKIYTTDFHVETKADNTPVTLADKASGKTISALLAQSSFPIISEEESISEYKIRKTWDFVWIVDPLDGTKEFIKRNGEFTVNIALVEKGRPVVGVIYAPVMKDLYFAARDVGAFKITQHENILEFTNEKVASDLYRFAKKLPLQKLPKDYTVIASRSHLNREINAHIEDLKNIYGQVNMINIGSSIKQCWVAEGRAHEYARFGLTMEWDTAAGQCILEESGNRLIDLETDLPMKYNKENLQNNYFIAKHTSQDFSKEE